MADVKGTSKQGEELPGTDGADVFIFEPGRVNLNAHSPFANPDLILKFQPFDPDDKNKEAIDKIDLSALDKTNFDFVGTDAKLADADKKSIADGYDSKNGLVVVDLDRNGQFSAGDLVLKLDNKPKELTRDNFILPQDLVPPGEEGENGAGGDNPDQGIVVRMPVDPGTGVLLPVNGANGLGPGTAVQGTTVLAGIEGEAHSSSATRLDVADTP